MHTVQDYCINFCIELTFLVTCHRYSIMKKYSALLYFLRFYVSKCVQYVYQFSVTFSKQFFFLFSTGKIFIIYLLSFVLASTTYPTHIPLSHPSPLPTFQTRRQNINECVYSHLCIEKNRGYTDPPILIQWIELYSGESCIQLGFSSLPPHLHKSLLKILLELQQEK